MTIQPFKNYAEKENFEKELKEMILTPKERNKKLNGNQLLIECIVNGVKITATQLIGTRLE